MRSGIQERFDQAIQGRAIGEQFRLEGQAFSLAEDGDAVVAQGTADQDHVAGLGPVRADGDTLTHDAHAGGVDVDAVAMAALDHLRVASDDLDPGLARRFCHRAHHPLQHLNLQSLFQDESSGEPERPGAAHRHIVDGAVDSQRTDVAAGEKERANGEGVGGHSQLQLASRKIASLQVEFYHAGVGQLAQVGVVQRRGEDLADEFVHHLPAGAVGHTNDFFHWDFFRNVSFVSIRLDCKL